jgi:hypothetical protein
MGRANEQNGEMKEKVALRQKMLVGRAEPGEALRELVGAQGGGPLPSRLRARLNVEHGVPQ